ncbi:MAG: hypothetical protein AB7Q17_16495 [Phycisphaerae bacterium]
MFPVPLTPFEQYMWMDDRPSHPMAFHIRLVFTGQIDEQELRRAIEHSIGRHPLLSARIAQSRPGKWYWTAAPSEGPYVDFAPAGQPMRYPRSARIDLRCESGVRIWARSGVPASEIRFQFHHACCDGIGAYQFIEDVLCSYDALVASGSDASLRALDYSALTRRMRPWSMEPGSVRRTAQQVWGVVAGTAAMLFGRPAPLCSPDTSLGEAGPNAVLTDLPAHTFSHAESRRLRNIAFACGGSLNDLLLRDLFVALRGWNARHDPRARRRRIRIIIPTSLRGPGAPDGTAANVVSIVFMGRGAGCERDPRRMLRWIQWETRFLLGWRLNLSFLRACDIFGAAPGAMEWMASANRCFATSVLSNMGRVLSRAPLQRHDYKLLVGGATLERVESAPPVRPHTAAALTSLTYGRRLTLAMNYDPLHFRKDSAVELMDHIVQQVRKTLEG